MAAPPPSRLRGATAIAGLALLVAIGACETADQTLTSNDGATLLVPAGAWDDSEPLEIVPDEAPVPLPDGYTAVSEVYALLPHGATFAVPVTVSLPYTADGFADLAVLRLGDDMDEIWQPLAGATFDGTIATVETLEFSWYVVAEFVGSGDDDDAVDDDDSSSDLVELEGDLLIQDNAGMSDFCATYGGLTGDLEIVGPAVTDGTLLDCLVSIGGGLDVHDSALPELRLPALETVGGALQFASNNSLVDVAAPAMTSAGSIEVTFSPALQTLDFSTLQDLDGDLLVEAAAPLSSVALPALVDLAGSFLLSGSEDLVALDLGALESVGGDFSVTAAVPLESVELGSLRTVGGSFQDAVTEALVELDLGSLESVGDDLRLGVSQSLTTLDLDSLQSVGGVLHISDCPLTALSLGSLQQVASLWVTEAPIGHLDLSALEGTTVGGLWLRDMQSVDLGALTSVSGGVLIDVLGSPTLELPVLSSAGGLNFLQADALVSFQAPLLTTLADELVLDSNALLSSLQLPSLGSVGGEFRIQDNPALPTSAAEALRDQIGVGNIGGAITISGNGPG